MDTNFVYIPFWLITTKYVAREDVFEVREVSCKQCISTWDDFTSFSSFLIGSIITRR